MDGCEMCPSDASGRFSYRVLNAVPVREERLCAECAAVTAGLASVVDFDLVDSNGEGES